MMADGQVRDGLERAVLTLSELSDLPANASKVEIGNWANDVTMELHNAGRYMEAIEVNENILNINWGKSNDLFHENALRDIADEYAYMGNLDKCLELYQEYLTKDPHWGWGWIGYYRQLDAHSDDRFEKVLDDLYQRINAGEDFRDKEDLYRELGDEYNTLGNQERADYFYGLKMRKRLILRER